jgi:hypothetical protein
VSIGVLLFLCEETMHNLPEQVGLDCLHHQCVGVKPQWPRRAEQGLLRVPTFLWVFLRFSSWLQDRIVQRWFRLDLSVEQYHFYHLAFLIEVGTS